MDSSLKTILSNGFCKMGNVERIINPLQQLHFFKKIIWYLLFKP
jgi:uncharacterized protein YlbG (UPF0298 family)